MTVVDGSTRKQRHDQLHRRRSGPEGRHGNQVPRLRQGRCALRGRRQPDHRGLDFLRQHRCHGCRCLDQQRRFGVDFELFVLNNKARYFFAGPHPDPNTGGGLRIEDTAKVEISGSVIQANTADTDGAAFSINNAGEVTLADTFVATTRWPSLNPRRVTTISVPPGSSLTRPRSPVLSSSATPAGHPRWSPDHRCRKDFRQRHRKQRHRRSLPTAASYSAETSRHADTNNVTATVSNTTITGNQGRQPGIGSDQHRLES